MYNNSINFELIMYMILYFLLLYLQLEQNTKFGEKNRTVLCYFCFYSKNILKNLIHLNMANKIFYYLTIASLAIGMSSCNKEETPSTVYGKAYPVILKAQSIGLEADQAPEAYIKGEGIGVSLLETGTDNVVTPNSNVRYIADGIGYYFVAANNDSIIYMPENGDQKDIATYYPRIAGITDKISIDLNTDQELGARLQFGRINGLSKDNREAEIKMKNALSMVSIDIDATAFDAQSMTAVLQNTPLQGNMSIYNGTFEATEFGTLVMTEGTALSRADNDIKKFYTMVIPAQIVINTDEGSTSGTEVQAAESKIEITITKNDGTTKPVEIKLSEYTQSLESAMNTNFSITVNNEGEAEVKVTNTSFTINDWVIDGDGIDVDGSESL